MDSDERSSKRMKIDENTNSSDQFDENSILTIDDSSFSHEILKKAFGLTTLFDVTLLGGLDSVCVSAHRVILAAATEYFATKFGTNTTMHSVEQKLRIDEVTGKSLKLLVDFCYTGKIHITADNVLDLLATARVTQFTRIQNECKRFLEQQLKQNPKKFYSVYLISKEYAFTDLTNKTLQMICENFEEVSKSVEFCKFDFDSMKTILGGVEWFDVSEEKIFEAAMQWVEYRKSARNQYVPNILELIRLAQIDVKYLHDHVKPVCELHNCSNLLITALTWHFLNATHSKDKDLLLPKHLTAKRTLPEKMFVIAGDNATNAISIEKYCLRSKKWCLTENLHLSDFKNVHRLAVMGDKLYFTVNPETNLIDSKIVHCVDLVTLNRSTVAPLSIGRHSHSFAVVKNTLYVIGGRGRIDWLGSVERYDLNKNQWINCAPMTRRRCNVGVAVLERNTKSQMYVIGGELVGTPLNTVERYRPDQNTWSRLPDMTLNRQNPGVGVLNERIYVLGGHNHKTLDCVECYDPNTGVWTTIASLSAARSAIAVATYENELFAIGGSSGTNKLNIVERYSADENQWIKIDSLNKPRAFSVIQIK